LTSQLDQQPGGFGVITHSPFDWQQTLPIGQVTLSHLPGVASPVGASLPASVDAEPPVEPPDPAADPPVPAEPLLPVVVPDPPVPEPPLPPPPDAVVPAPPVELPPVPAPAAPVVPVVPEESSPPQAPMNAKGAAISVIAIQSRFRILISLFEISAERTSTSRPPA
jgi:hypothetical protein